MSLRMPVVNQENSKDQKIIVGLDPLDIFKLVSNLISLIKQWFYIVAVVDMSGLNWPKS